MLLLDWTCQGISMFGAYIVLSASDWFFPILVFFLFACANLAVLILQYLFHFESTSLISISRTYFYSPLFLLFVLFQRKSLLLWCAETWFCWYRIHLKLLFFWRLHEFSNQIKIFYGKAKLLCQIKNPSYYKSTSQDQI